MPLLNSAANLRYACEICSRSEQGIRQVSGKVRGECAGKTQDSKPGFTHILGVEQKAWGTEVEDCTWNQNFCNRLFAMLRCGTNSLNRSSEEGTAGEEGLTLLGVNWKLEAHNRFENVDLCVWCASRTYVRKSFEHWTQTRCTTELLETDQEV